MSFKDFSSTHSAPRKDYPDGKSKDVPPVNQPRAQPEKTPADVASAPKS